MFLRHWDCVQLLFKKFRSLALTRQPQTTSWNFKNEYNSRGFPALELVASSLESREPSFFLASAFYFKRAHKRPKTWAQLRRGLKVRLNYFKVITGWKDKSSPLIQKQQHCLKSKTRISKGFCQKKSFIFNHPFTKIYLNPSVSTLSSVFGY